jgi:hypothetical protein
MDAEPRATRSSSRPRRRSVKRSPTTSLPSEEAFELPTLGHGVLTYVKTRPDPLAIVNNWKASDHEPSEEGLRGLRKIDREIVHYLMSGRQHALDLINGHAISMLGSRHGDLELGDSEWSLE